MSEICNNHRALSRQFGEAVVEFSCAALTILRLSDSLCANLWEFADMTRRVPASSHQTLTASALRYDRHYSCACE